MILSMGPDDDSAPSANRQPAFEHTYGLDGPASHEYSPFEEAWEMARKSKNRNLRFPLFVNDNPFRRFFLPPDRLVKGCVTDGQVVADLGCGPGFYTIALAEAVGPGGKVYAVDWDVKPIRALERKAAKRGRRNIESRVSSAAELDFIKDGSVDFVFANGLLCSMASQNHVSTVNEIKRILKSGIGRAYLSVARGPWSHVDGPAWNRILAAFKVERRGDGFPWIAHRWAVVSTLP